MHQPLKRCPALLAQCFSISVATDLRPPTLLAFGLPASVLADVHPVTILAQLLFSPVLTQPRRITTVLAVHLRTSMLAENHHPAYLASPPLITMLTNRMAAAFRFLLAVFTHHRPQTQPAGGFEAIVLTDLRPLA